MIRLGVVSLCWSISQPISYPLGSWLFDSGGYVCVFSVSLLLFVVSSLLGLWALWGFKEKIEKKEASFSDLLSPRHVVDSVKTTFRKRENKKRFYLVSMLFVMLAHVMQSDAESQCQFMYTKRLFGWDVKDYSFYSMMHVGLGLISIFFNSFISRQLG